MPIASLDRLIARDRILRRVREFFWSREFLEIETPIVLAHPSQEPHLEPLRTSVHDAHGRGYDAFLRMSPEFSLKKLTAHMCGHCEEPGDEAIPTGVFEIGPVFRDGEPWGETHNPEFTMLEWYRRDADYRILMDDCEAIFSSLLVISSEAKRSREISGRSVGDSSARRGLGRNDDGVLVYQGQRIDLGTPWERLTMRQAWKRHARLDLDALLTRGTIARACRQRGYIVHASDTYDDLFFKIHLTEVEPKLGVARPTFLTEWPASMAALARTKPRDSRYAERVELYIGGLEIANGFSELTDADEQLRRFRQEQRLRKRLGRPVFPIDRAFIAALRRMPPTAGIALGVDRLVMLLLDAKTIDEVRWLPARELFAGSSVS